MKYKLQVTKAPKHSGIIFQNQPMFPAQVKLNVERKKTKLTKLKPKVRKQQEPKHLGGRTSSLEYDSDKLVITVVSSLWH